MIEHEILYRSYGCTTKEQFDEYRKHHKVMTLNEAKVATMELIKMGMFSKVEVERLKKLGLKI